MNIVFDCGYLEILLTPLATTLLAVIIFTAMVLNHVRKEARAERESLLKDLRGEN